MGGYRWTPTKIVIFWTYEKPHCRGGNYVVGGEEGYLIFFKLALEKVGMNGHGLMDQQMTGQNSVIIGLGLMDQQMTG